MFYTSLVGRIPRVHSWNVCKWWIPAKSSLSRTAPPSPPPPSAPPPSAPLLPHQVWAARRSRSISAKHFCRPLFVDDAPLGIGASDVGSELGNAFGNRLAHLGGKERRQKFRLRFPHALQDAGREKTHCKCHIWSRPACDQPSDRLLFRLPSLHDISARALS